MECGPANELVFLFPFSGRRELDPGLMHPMHAYYHYTTARLTRVIPSRACPVVSDRGRSTTGVEGSRWQHLGRDFSTRSCSLEMTEEVLASNQNGSKAPGECSGGKPGGCPQSRSRGIG